MKTARPWPHYKFVGVLDAIPVTAVGKPYKLRLRAEAARSAVASALGDTAAVTAIDACAEDGETVVTITVDSLADRRAVEEVLSRYTFTYRITESPTP